MDHEDFDKVWALLQDVQGMFEDLTDDESDAIELIIATCQPSGWTPAED